MPYRPLALALLLALAPLAQALEPQSDADDLLAALAQRGEPAALVTLTMADLERSRQRFATSVYAEIVQLMPTPATMRLVMPTPLGPSTIDLLKQVSAAHGQLEALPIDGGVATANLSVHAPGLADEIWRNLSAAGDPLPDIAEADGAVRLDDAAVLVRRAAWFDVHFNREPTPLAAPQPTAADLTLSVDCAGLAAAARRELGDRTPGLVDLLAGLGTLRYAARLVDAGLHEMALTDPLGETYRNIDPRVFAHLDAQTIGMLALSLDGEQLWRLLTALLPPDELAKAEAGWQELGLPHDLPATCRSLAGTAVVALRRGPLLPGAVIAIPRSDALDAVLRALAKRARIVLPSPGSTALVHLPTPGGRETVPVIPTVACTEGHWVLSNAPAAVRAWTDGTGGWAESAAMRAALADHDPSQRLLALGALDLDTLTAIGADLLGTFGGMLPRDYRPLAAQVVALSQRRLHTGHFALEQADTRLRYRAQGLVGPALPAMAMAIAGVRWQIAARARRGRAQEHAAMFALRHGVHPAQVTWQGSAFNDVDMDSMGEFGFLDQLSGRVAPFSAKLEVELIDDWPQRDGVHVRNGYCFKIYVGLAGKGMVDFATMQELVAAGELTAEQLRPAELHYVCYAWPEDPDRQGQRLFAITEAGTLYATPFAAGDAPPAWNALSDGTATTAAELAEPTWEPVWQPRRDRAR